MTKIASAKLLKGHTDKVLALDLDPTDRLIVSGSQDKTVRLWDLNTNKTNILRGHGGSDWFSKVNAVAISPNGKILASGSKDKTLKLWDLAKGTLITTIPHQGSVTAVKFGRKENILITACEDKIIRIFSGLFPQKTLNL